MTNLFYYAKAKKSKLDSSYASYFDCFKPLS